MARRDGAGVRLFTNKLEYGKSVVVSDDCLAIDQE